MKWSRGIERGLAAFVFSCWWVVVVGSILGANAVLVNLNTRTESYGVQSFALCAVGVLAGGAGIALARLIKKKWGPR